MSSEPTIAPPPDGIPGGTFDDRPGPAKLPEALRLAIAREVEAVGAALDAGQDNRAERVAGRVGRSLVRWSERTRYATVLRSRPRRSRPRPRARTPRRSSGRRASASTPPTNRTPQPPGRPPRPRRRRAPAARTMPPAVARDPAAPAPRAVDHAPGLHPLRPAPQGGATGHARGGSLPRRRSPGRPRWRPRRLRATAGRRAGPAPGPRLPAAGRQRGTTTWPRASGARTRRDPPRAQGRRPRPSAAISDRRAGGQRLGVAPVRAAVEIAPGGRARGRPRGRGRQSTRIIPGDRRPPGLAESDPGRREDRP